MSVHRLISVLLAAAAIAAPAHALDYMFRVHGAAAYVVPVADSDIDSIDTEAADSLGYEIGVEWKATKLLGIELAYLNVEQDLEQLGTSVGTVDLEPVSVTANFHPIRTRLLTFWAGPTVSWANWGNLELSDGSRIETSSSFAYGASTGVNVSLWKLLALHAGVRWLKLDVEEADTGQSLDVDPLFINLGIAVRF